jgi:hypothetical protein
MQLGGEADEGQHAAAGVSDAAVGGIPGLAVSAGVDGENMARFEAELQQLAAVGRAEVEKIPAGASGDRTEERSRKAGLLEGCAEVLPDLVTRSADAGAKGGQEGGRIGALVLFHPQHSFF